MTDDGMPGRLPNLLIAGAPRCGTTSLYHYLNQHPDVFMSPLKEPSFFWMASCDTRPTGRAATDARHVFDLDSYRALFAGAAGAKIRGEASPENLYLHEQVIPLIKAHLGDPYIVINLRNPVERAFSAYMLKVREGFEEIPFEAALDAEAQRREDGWHYSWFYRDVGYYAAQVQAYLENFSRVMVHLFDDLKQRPDEVVRRTYRFLGVDPDVPTDTRMRYNGAGVPRLKRLYRFVTRPSRAQRAVRNVASRLLGEQRLVRWRDIYKTRSVGERRQIRPATADALRRDYADDIRRLSALLGRDLEHWLQAQPEPAAAGDGARPAPHA